MGKAYLQPSLMAAEECIVVLRLEERREAGAAGRRTLSCNSRIALSYIDFIQVCFLQ